MEGENNRNTHNKWQKIKKNRQTCQLFSRKIIKIYQSKCHGGGESTKESYINFLSLRVTLSLIQDPSATPGQTSRISIK